jgi:hypothetical protein
MIPKEYIEFYDIFTLLLDSKLLRYSLFHYKIKIKDSKELKFILIYLLL